MCRGDYQLLGPEGVKWPLITNGTRPQLIIALITSAVNWAANWSTKNQRQQELQLLRIYCFIGISEYFSLAISPALAVSYVAFGAHRAVTVFEILRMPRPRRSDALVPLNNTSGPRTCPSLGANITTVNPEWSP